MNCLCKFSSGGVQGQECEYHRRQIAAAVAAEREACAAACDAGAGDIDGVNDEQRAAVSALRAAAAAIRARR